MARTVSQTRHYTQRTLLTPGPAQSIASDGSYPGEPSLYWAVQYVLALSAIRLECASFGGGLDEMVVLDRIDWSRWR